MPGIELNSEPLSLLCDPDTRYAFEREGTTLRNVATGRVYPVRDGIPLFVSSLTGNNLRSQVLYDRVAPFYDAIARLYVWLSQVPDPRRDFFATLPLARGARVLEVGIGTGANLPYLPGGIDLYGVDISWQMLHRCQNKALKQGRTVRLFQAEGCRLPFRAAQFDAVIQTLGIRGFNSPSRAIREMIWVARPGAQILLVENIPQADKRRTFAAAAAQSLVEWIPEDMEDVQVRMLGGGAFECVSFRLPQGDAKATED
jgi:ubiquinone/menaquinone biosynthesis C-methylase UbiE